MATQRKHSVLFVCLGNICRSTMAEGIFQHLVAQRGLTDQWLIDSAGTGNWHVGCPPDERTMKVLKKNGVTGYNHIVRVACFQMLCALLTIIVIEAPLKLWKEDFTKFEYIFGMDDENISDINEFAPKNSTATVELLGKYDPQNELIIEDPYYAYSRNKNAFNEVYDQCLRCCTGFLDAVSAK